eukprot:scaffold45_cov337-Pavlova_lutheri.AAC.30
MPLHLVPEDGHVESFSVVCDEKDVFRIAGLPVCVYPVHKLWNHVSELGLRRHHFLRDSMILEIRSRQGSGSSRSVDQRGDFHDAIGFGAQARGFQVEDHHDGGFWRWVRCARLCCEPGRAPGCTWTRAPASFAATWRPRTILAVAWFHHASAAGCRSHTAPPRAAGNQRQATHRSGRRASVRKRASARNVLHVCSSFPCRPEACSRSILDRTRIVSGSIGNPTRVSARSVPSIAQFTTELTRPDGGAYASPSIRPDTEYR